MGNRARNVQLHFFITPEEKYMITERAHQANFNNVSAYLLKMALNGYILQLDIDEITEMNRLLGNATNNINQIARRVNETGKIYAATIVMEPGAKGDKYVNFSLQFSEGAKK